MKYQVTREELESMRKSLEKLRDGFPEQWKVSRGAGGQDQYVGYPPGMRIVDDVIRSIDWIQMRPPAAIAESDSRSKQNRQNVQDEK